MSKVLRKLLTSIADQRGCPPTAVDMVEISKTLRFIQSDSFPCVGAKSALVQDGVEFRVYDNLIRDANDTALHLDIQEYLTRLNPEDARVQSFVAIFKTPQDLSEAEFETALWDRLKGLHKMNRDLDIPWNPNVSSDPDNPHFSMSIAGHPFFIVGMHAGASRISRRSPYPTLVFNSNVQFDRLKADGRYEKLQSVIRQRDEALQGSINPNLADFGQASEARQYSGRPVSESWACPAHFGAKKDEP
ncbi:MAG: guanitoxin biosynthesis heme-dependent pre-guanitoxin N-hydroxylase GntA [Litorimonas sp.]